MTELFNTYLKTDGVANKIAVLTKKTSSSQFDIGKLILSVETQMNDLIDPIKMKKVIEKNKEVKKSLDAQIEAVVAEYDLFLSTLPFGKVVAKKFAAIASDALIEKYLDVAPIAYNTMYDMKDTPEDMWKYLKKEGMTSYTSMTAVKVMKAEYIALTSDPVVDAPVVDAPVDEAPAKELTKGEKLDKAVELAKKVGAIKAKPELSDIKVSDLKTSADITFVDTAVVKINQNVSKEQFSELYAQLENVVSAFAKSNSLNKDDVVLEKNVSFNELDVAA